MWDHTEGFVGTAELTSHETQSHYSNFDSAYSEITDLIVASTFVFNLAHAKKLYYKWSAT